MSHVPSRLCTVTLGARNVPRLRRFYRGLGWAELPEGDNGRAGFLLAGVLLVLYPLAEPAAGAERGAAGAGGWSGITLTCAVDSSQQVDAAFAAAVAADATAVAGPADRPSGGRSAYIADPEGNRWEIAWEPFRGWLTTEASPAPGVLAEPPRHPTGTESRPRESAGLEPPRRATAELLHHRGAPDEAVAAHLVAAGGSGPGWAAETLLCAARSARREGRPEQAVDYLRRALAEPLRPSRRGGVLTELGTLEVTLGPAERASGIRHLAESVRLEPQSDVSVFKAANALGTALAARGQTSTALEVMEELAERFTGHPELACAVQGAAALIASHDGHSWLETVHRLRRLATGSPLPPAPGARALLAEFDSTSGQLTAAQAVAVAHEVTAQPLDPFSRTYVLASAATLAQWADELELADRLVADGMAGHRGPLVDPGYQSLLSVHAESLVMRGRYRELLEACHDWGILAGPPRPVPSGFDNAHLVAQAVIALTETDRIAEARQLAGTVAADSSQGSWEWNEFLYARGMLSLAEGAPAAALDDLLECGRRQSARQVISPIVTPWRSAAADCQLLLGRPGAAVALAAEELETARRWGTPRCVGRAMRALGTATGSRAGLTMVGQAVDLLGTTADTTPELISALAAHGRMLSEAGHLTAARQALRSAARHAEPIGADRLRTVVAEQLAAAGARRATACQTGAHALTSSERRICDLAAQGHSNPEIAALLRLALRTVETHLTNSFRKLGVRRRTELARQLLTDPAARAQ
ncbi:LuxR C-terminal-related transcriptional regulator [Streptomyces sp. NPDC059161]|uniref:LuxR C-terminal-related transcriptional regulator n=1 Tax=Streptomyces sp. NPDC059161 TaxID=3346749 RepID=UPI0036738754